LNNGPSTGCSRVEKIDFGTEGEVKNGPMAWEVIDSSSLPTDWDWRNVNGTNFCGWSKN
jgi:hypothetical protein